MSVEEEEDRDRFFENKPNVDITFFFFLPYLIVDLYIFDTSSVFFWNLFLIQVAVTIKSKKKEKKKRKQKKKAEIVF